MPAAVVNLYCEQGSTFYKEVVLPGQDLTGYTVRGQVRDVVSGAKAVDLTCSSPAVVPATETVAVSSSFNFSLTATQTTALPTLGKRFSDVTRYAYDLELVSGDTVVRFFNGDFVVSPESTK